jgi:hypothetical protein
MKSDDFFLLDGEIQRFLWENVENQKGCDHLIEALGCRR